MKMTSKHLLITSNLNSHTTTDIKPEMEFHMINVVYVALPSCVPKQKRRHFPAKPTGNILLRGFFLY